MSSKKPTHQSVIEKVLEANSITALMGWAAMGQEYAGCSNHLSSPCGADYTNAAAVVNRLLIDVCGDLEALAANEINNTVQHFGFKPSLEAAA